MVEPGFYQARGRGKCRNVTTDTSATARSLYDHGHRVPADNRANLAFDLAVTRIARLSIDGNRINIRSRQAGSTRNTFGRSPLLQFEQQSANFFRPITMEDIIE